MFTNIRILAGWLGVLGFSTLIALPAYSQNEPINRGNTSPSRTLLNEPIIQVNPGLQDQNGSSTSYPYGSSIRGSGAITTPSGQVIYPSVRIRNGDGSITYHYSNGARVTLDRTQLPASGINLLR